MENIGLIKLDDLRQFMREVRDEKRDLVTQAIDEKSAAPPITTKELCAFLNVTEPTIIRWRKKGKIPFMQIGSAVRFNLSAVIAALEVKKKTKN